MTTSVLESVREQARSRRGIAVGGVLVLVLAAFLAFEWGQRHPDVHTETLGCLSAEVFISCGYPDSPGHPILVVPIDVTLWTDAQGTTHNGGRPTCLPPVGIGTIEARVSWVEFRRYGGTHRAVVSVECLR